MQTFVKFLETKIVCVWLEIVNTKDEECSVKNIFIRIHLFGIDSLFFRAVVPFHSISLRSSFSLYRAECSFFSMVNACNATNGGNVIIAFSLQTLTSVYELQIQKIQNDIHTAQLYGFAIEQCCLAFCCCALFS